MPNIPEQWFEREILLSLGFILDMEAEHLFPRDVVEIGGSRPMMPRTQFVHKSGAAFCQIHQDGFYFVKNRPLLATPAYWRNAGAITPDEIRVRLESFCLDATRLGEFYLQKI